jgi:hypothetical protein
MVSLDGGYLSYGPQAVRLAAAKNACGSGAAKVACGSRVYNAPQGPVPESLRRREMLFQISTLIIKVPLIRILFKKLVIMTYIC